MCIRDRFLYPTIKNRKGDGGGGGRGGGSSKDGGDTRKDDGKTKPTISHSNAVRNARRYLNHIDATQAEALETIEAEVITVKIEECKCTDVSSVRL